VFIRAHSWLNPFAVLDSLLQRLASGEPLTNAQIRLAVEQLIDERISAEAKVEFLTALARKSETADEIAGFAAELRERAVPCVLEEDLRQGEILDVVGTGGDGLGTFNISTTVALIAASAGVRVAKHGNRASTSPTGSADVLAALRIPNDLGPAEAARAVREHGFAFFFAPKYHPAFRNIAPARKLCAERGQRTIFNFLGPLLNPACPSAMLVGVPRPGLCEPMARVLQTMGVRRAMVVCGEVPVGAMGGIPVPSHGAPAYLDEVSSLGPTTVAEFYQEKGFNVSTLSPEAFPLQPATLADLRGGDPEVNAFLTRRILAGKERGPKRDIVLLNAAAAIFVAARARSLSEGWELAERLIDSGKAQSKLEELAGG
jgi:anthranilate phosphoribosyltransferase